MSELDEYIKMNTDFLRLADGQSFEGTYTGLEFVADRFDLKNKNKIPCYKLKWNDIDKEIEWTTKSMKVAGNMSAFKPGDKIKITRHGEDTNTTYDVSKVQYPLMDWPYNICLVNSCTEQDCEKITKQRCGGQFWIRESGCINYADHLNLNLNTSEFVQADISRGTDKNACRIATKRRKGQRIK